jgi:DNA-directed RNA polymerase
VFADKDGVLVLVGSEGTGRVIAFTSAVQTLLHACVPLGLADWLQIKTSLQHISLQPARLRAVNKSRQRTAFPPNFVHCLDSAHMMRTASACAAEGLTFAGVHDSFWTHAASVDRLGVLLREQFIALHSEPLLENLAAELRARNPGVELAPVPPKGDFDLAQIRSSLYFFC